MDIYLVGGAVRDKRLGLPVRERDWVVVGTTPGEMLRLGYKPVGRHFPVFLHPDTREEYALARTERKTGPGYTGFETHTGPDITLEQDLQRRDLTINAMAETPDGELIDPCGGADDLANGVLRHVSSAFSEDPVRILRVARFAARFAHWGFHVAHGTNALMRRMVQAGEVDHLVPERVWAELVRALAEKNPERFFDVLYGCGALARLFPEIEPLYINADNEGHGGGSVGSSVLACLCEAARRTVRAEIRFAALVCDQDKGEGTGLDTGQLMALSNRLRIPNAYRKLAEMTLRHRARVHGSERLSAGDLLELLDALDAFRRSERFADFLQVCEIDASVHHRKLHGDYVQGSRLERARQAALAVKPDGSPAAGLSGKAIGEALHQARIQAIQDTLGDR